MRYSFLALTAFLAGCSCQGPAGPVGPPGPSPDLGPPVDLGPRPDGGPPPVNCWDTNGNGVADPAEDLNADSVWDARDCVGPIGPGGDGGAPGLACWDTNGNFVQDAAEDTNGDGMFDALDCAGSILGTLAGTVIDKDTRALIEGAAVMIEPGGFTTTTVAAGTFAAPALPAGVYRVTVTAPSLAQEGALMVPDRSVSLVIDDIRILAGQRSQVRMALGRLALQRLNLTSLHAATLSGAANPRYVEPNCVACHSDRAAEVSTVPTIVTYHALPEHSASSCTYCHADGVDVGGVGGWNNESAAGLRRQVDIAVCTGCHRCFPTSFCAAGATACPTPCP